MTFATSSLGILYAEAQARQLEAALTDELARVEAFVKAIPIPVPVSPSTPNGPKPAAGGGGCCTQEQLTRLARCESGTNPFAGDPSPWRTGYFGLEQGYPIGQMSLAWQIGEVERIYAQYGARAWGCAAAFYG